MERKIYKEIEGFIHSKTHDVLVVNGARQVGKTYGVDWVLDRVGLPSIRINLERDLRLRANIDNCVEFKDFTFLLKNEFAFDENGSQIIFIDEAQESEQLGRFIRFMHEEWRNKKTIITGSSTTRLFKEDQRVPVGRYATLTFSPFSFAEYLEFLEKRAQLSVLETASQGPLSIIAHQTLLKEIDAYLSIGGMPQVLAALKRNEDYKNVRTEIVLSQKEDFIRKAQVGNAILFDECMAAVANHVGAPSKYSESGKPYHQVKSILSMLINWLLIIEVHRQGMDPNKGDYLPKRYLYDCGVLRHYQNRPFQGTSIVDAAQPALRTHLGGIFENMALLELKRSYFKNAPITTWKRSQGTAQEVDFVVEQGGQFIPVECKASLKVTNRSFVNVIKYLELSGGDLGYLISAAPYEEYKVAGKRLLNLPIYMAGML